MRDAKEELLNVLKETRELLALPENDFGWSTWDNAVEAFTEFDQFIVNIEADRCFHAPRLSILFAPTGNIQEVSISSGWGREFVEVAAKFDAALWAYRHRI